MPRHYPPASLRYLKARLLNLARPGFWGTAIFLSLVGLIIKQYWTDPDFFTRWQKNQVASNQPANSSLSAEDRAIAVDIDNLPVLFNDIKPTSLPPTQSTSKENQKANDNTESLLDNSKNQTNPSDAKSKSGLEIVNSAPTAKTENPFLVQAENLLQLGNFQGVQNLSGVNSLTGSSVQQGAEKTSLSQGIAIVNKTNSSQNVVPNPLQTAINQSPNQNQPSLNGTTSTQINPFGQSPLPTNSLPNQILPSTGLTRNASNPFSTQTSYPQLGLTNQQPNIIPGTNYPQPGLTNQQPNIIPGTNYQQPGLTNQQPNIIPGTNYPQPGLTNQQPNLIPGTNYPQPGLTNQQPNSNSIRSRAVNILNRYYNTNLNSGQASPSVTQPPPVVSPNTSAAPTNIAPFYTPTPNQGIVNYTTQVVPYNYGNSGLQQPNQVPQNNLSSPR